MNTSSKAHNHNRFILSEIIYERGNRGFRVRDVRDAYFAKLKELCIQDATLGGGQSIEDLIRDYLNTGLLVVRGSIYRLNPTFQEDE